MAKREKKPVQFQLVGLIKQYVRKKRSCVIKRAISF